MERGPEEMNRSRRGRQFLLPRSLIEFVEVIRNVLSIPFNQKEDLLPPSSALLPIQVPNHSTLWCKRGEGMDLHVPSLGCNGDG